MTQALPVATGLAEAAPVPQISRDTLLRPTVVKSHQPSSLLPADAASKQNGSNTTFLSNERLATVSGAVKDAKESSAAAKRSSRKSKSQALANLNAQSASLKASLQADMEAGHPINAKDLPRERSLPPDQNTPGPHLHPARKQAAAPIGSGLDYSTLPLLLPRNFPQRTESRPFGFPHCPVFRPTPEEFSKPMEYIEKITRDVSETHGILKVIPPDGWKPPFSLDSKVGLTATLPEIPKALRASLSEHLADFTMLGLADFPLQDQDSETQLHGGLSQGQCQLPRPIRRLSLSETWHRRIYSCHPRANTGPLEAAKMRAGIGWLQQGA